MKLLEKIIIPHDNVNDRTVTITELFHKNGDKLNKGDRVLSFETSKSEMVLESSYEGYVKYYCEIMEEEEIGATVAEIYDVITENEETSAQTYTKDVSSAYDPYITDKAKELIETNALKVSDFDGKEIITEEVVLKLLNGSSVVKNAEKILENKSIPVNPNYRSEKLSANKKREIEYLSAVQRSGLVTSLTVFVDDADFSSTIFSEMKILKNSILPVIIFETSRLLKKYPALNAFYQEGSINYYNSVNIGVALEFDRGLKVAVVGSADTKDVFTIEDEVIKLSDKYINEALSSSDMANSTFTISDLFNGNVSFFTPLVNKNQAAILAIGSQDETGKGFFLTLSYDHRVVTGKYASGFMADLKSRLKSYNYSPNTINNNNGSKTCYNCNITLKEQTELQNTGLIKIETMEGEKLICLDCLTGWR